MPGRGAPRQRLAALVWLTAMHAGTGHAFCDARAEIVPASALVGQQIVHRVRIERSADVERTHWIDPPRFADFRAEWLPGGPELRQTASDGSVRYVREELRALFPLRAGQLEVSPARIACTSGEANARVGEASEVALPALRLDARRPPKAGRPDDWTGLVGRPRLRLLPLPDRIRLGETLRVSVLLLGPVNLWDAPDALDRDALVMGGPAPDVFPAESGLELDRGARLQLRRIDRLDVVPRQTGTLRIRTRESGRRRRAPPWRCCPSRPRAPESRHAAPGSNAGQGRRATRSGPSRG
jgi:hypothetical protein